MSFMPAARGVDSVLSRINEIESRLQMTSTHAYAGQALGQAERSAEFSTMYGNYTNSYGNRPWLTPSSNDAGEALVQQATNYLGVPYLWGGTNPDQGLDCSGFTQRVHRDMGIEIPRVSRDQAKGGEAVASLDEARPGDVLVFGTPVNHVAIYMGDGKMIHAPRRGDVVKIEPIDRPIVGIRRYTPTTSSVQGAAGFATGLPVNQAAVAAGLGNTNNAGAAPYMSMFQSAGAKYGISPQVLEAVAQVESGFNPQAVSSAGALGLMQFMPQTAAGMGIDPLDPAQAIDGAARYLSDQMRDFGRLDLALAAYNAGPGAVRRHGGIPPYTQTQSYVTKVLGLVNGASN